MGSILLLGLDSDLSDPLSVILKQLGHHVMETMLTASVPSELHCDVAFIAADSEQYRDVVRNLRASHDGLPLILVNRFPENDRWLDALEIGAADYCGAPFESVQIR